MYVSRYVCIQDIPFCIVCRTDIDRDVFVANDSYQKQSFRVLLLVIVIIIIIKIVIKQIAKRMTHFNDSFSNIN